MAKDTYLQPQSWDPTYTGWDDPDRREGDEILGDEMLRALESIRIELMAKGQPVIDKDWKKRNVGYKSVSFGRRLEQDARTSRQAA